MFIKNENTKSGIVGAQMKNKQLKNAKRNPKDESKPNFDTEELVSAWVFMWNSYDLSLVDELFLTESHVTYFSSEKEGLIKGINAIRDHHKGFGFVEGGKVQPNKLWVEDLHTIMYGPVGIVTGVWYFRRGEKDTGKTQNGPVTIIYLQIEDEYRIAHMHFANY